VDKSKISKVLDEYFSDISYGKGQGLWLHSFRIIAEGRVPSYEKTFFGAKRPPQNAR
jgi:hypothetical protein